jgi:hypothetical protein
MTRGRPRLPMKAPTHSCGLDIPRPSARRQGTVRFRLGGRLRSRPAAAVARRRRALAILRCRRAWSRASGPTRAAADARRCPQIPPRSPNSSLGTTPRGATSGSRASCASSATGSPRPRSAGSSRKPGSRRHRHAAATQAGGRSCAAGPISGLRKLTSRVDTNELDPRRTKVDLDGLADRLPPAPSQIGRTWIRTPKAGVAGSNPAGGTNRFRTHGGRVCQGRVGSWPGDVGWSSGCWAGCFRGSSSLAVCAVAWEVSSWSARLVFHNRQRRSSGRPSPQEPRRARTAADSSRQPVWHWPRQMDDRGRTRRPS